MYGVFGVDKAIKKLEMCSENTFGGREYSLAAEILRINKVIPISLKQVKKERTPFT